ncbi:uncharacterized protein LOC130361932 [Hyla sarda]|uniref:uncharacterized protein LOC130361932 n=1 Tax=Hyla sarda TaxID=327740 RepID=UPI0024C2FF63|nr:uncharacterized protein LOC130361932 [Hyla sarda]
MVLFHLLVFDYGRFCFVLSLPVSHSPVIPVSCAFPFLFLMADLRFLSWKIRGMGSSKKRALFFSHVRRYNPHIVCLQETHMMPANLGVFRKPWVQWASHSCHSTYSRGVSLLVHRSLRWEVDQLSVDSLGRYVFVHTFIDNTPFVLPGIYNPHPATLELLHLAVTFAAGFPHARVICLGDYNLTSDPDRFHVPTPLSSTPHPTPFSSFLFEVGWLDIFRCKFPRLRLYSCYSIGCNALSRIDLACCNPLFFFFLVSNISFGARAISDHFPLLVELLLSRVLCSEIEGASFLATADWPSRSDP